MSITGHYRPAKGLGGPIRTHFEPEHVSTDRLERVGHHQHSITMSGVDGKQD